MLALLTWLAGTVGLGYLIIKYHLWQTGIAAMTDITFVAWVLLGAAWLAHRFSGRAAPDKQSLDWAKAVHEAAERAEAARKARENVGS